MEQKTDTEVRATIEEIWSLAEVWQQSEFPLSQELADLYDRDNGYSEAAKLLHSFRQKFITEYADDFISALSLEPRSRVSTVISCPSAVGLEHLRDFEKDSAEFNFSSWLKPQRMVVKICVGQKVDDVMMDASLESDRYELYTKGKCGIGESQYTTVRQELHGECEAERDPCALIRRFASFLFLALKMSAHLDAGAMGEMGAVYSAYMSMAREIMAVGVNDGIVVSERKPLADKYSPAIVSVMQTAEQMYREAGGIQAIPWSTFEAFLGESASGAVTPVCRSNKGTNESPVWQDYELNRHRPNICVRNKHANSIVFTGEAVYRFSAFYASPPDMALPFRSSVQWNYPSSNFLFASVDLAAEMMRKRDSTDFDCLRNMVQSATQLIADLSGFERSFVRFFRRERLMSHL